MGISDINDARQRRIEASEQAQLLQEAAERSANKFGFVAGEAREAFIHGFIDGAVLMTKILRPTS